MSVTRVAGRPADWRKRLGRRWPEAIAKCSAAAASPTQTQSLPRPSQAVDRRGYAPEARRRPKRPRRLESWATGEITQRQRRRRSASRAVMRPEPPAADRSGRVDGIVAHGDCSSLAVGSRARPTVSRSLHVAAAVVAGPRPGRGSSTTPRTAHVWSVATARATEPTASARTRSACRGRLAPRGQRRPASEPMSTRPHPS